MWTKVGLVRKRKELVEADESLYQISAALEKHRVAMDLSQDNFDLNILSSIELYYKLQLARIITRSARMRNNTVGAHYLVDGKDHKERYNVVIQKEVSGDMRVIRDQDSN